MRGVRNVEGIGDLPSPGIQVSSQEHPIQGSMWAAYSARPGHRCTCKIAAMRGTPGALNLEKLIEFEQKVTKGRK
jgi:hypothetical protein